LQKLEPIRVFKCINVSMADNLKKLEKMSKALGDVNRLKILSLIAEQGGTGQCSAILERVGLAQPSVSHHIKILIEAGLIEAEKEGRNHKYILNKKNFSEYLTALSNQVTSGKE
jgi:ArsR family transcriptional regulator